MAAHLEVLVTGASSGATVGAPPFTSNAKSVAVFVPPSSLITSFFTISVPAWSSFVIVQVAVSPSARVMFEQPL